MRLTRAHRDDAIRAHALAREVLRHRRGALLGQRLVVGRRAGVVGVTGHLEQRLVELLQHQRHGVQHLEELGTKVGAVRLEGHVAGHVQRDVVAVARNAYARPLQLLAQLGLLPIHVVADGAASKRTDAGADQRVLAAFA